MREGAGSAFMWVAAVLAAFSFSCSRKTDDGGGHAQPLETYRNALDRADSASAVSERRASAVDSAAAGDR